MAGTSGSGAGAGTYCRDSSTQAGQYTGGVQHKYVSTQDRVGMLLKGPLACGCVQSTPAGTFQHTGSP
jgi:hypothetical protein